MYGIIYKATNILNGKVYIGQTVREFEDRIKQHIRDALGLRSSKYVFHVAIRKYGKDNFKFEIIDKADTKEELDEKEIYWINELRSYIHFDNSNGYNMTIGGNGFGIGRNHPRYGKKASKETIAKMIESRKKLNTCGENNPFYGRHHTDESLEKMKANRKGKNMGNTNKNGKCIGVENHMARAIIQMTIDGEFIAEYETITEASKAINGDSSTIVKVCKGKLKTHRGYKWQYKEQEQ